MSRYRRVKVATYTDEKFLGLTPQRPSGQTLWIYLLTGRHTTVIPGLSAAGLFTLAEHLKWPLPVLKRHWQEIERAGMAKADWSAPCIWLPNAILHNEPENPNVLQGWGKHVSEIPACELRDAALVELREYARGKGNAFASAFAKGFGKFFREGFQDSFRETGTGVQEQEVPPNPPVPGGPVISRREWREAVDERTQVAKATGRACPHEPGCASADDCVREYAIAARERRVIPA